MRISDWSSDVCSSDLLAWQSGVHRPPDAAADPAGRGGRCRGAARSAARFGARPEARVAHRHRRLHPSRLRAAGPEGGPGPRRSEEHTSELQSLMRISYAVVCLKKKKIQFKTNIIMTLI